MLTFFVLLFCIIFFSAVTSETFFVLFYLPNKTHTRTAKLNMMLLFYKQKQVKTIEEEYFLFWQKQNISFLCHFNDKQKRNTALTDKIERRKHFLHKQIIIFHAEVIINVLYILTYYLTQQTCLVLVCLFFFACILSVGRRLSFYYLFVIK